jgi:hypothetical protein
MARRHEVISKAVVVLQKFGDLLRRVGWLDETGPRRSSFHLNNDRTFGGCDRAGARDYAAFLGFFFLEPS